MKRRDFLREVAPAGAALMLSDWTAAIAAESQPSANLVVTPLTERLWVIAGGGGNVTVFNSPEGVLMVDGGSPEHSAQILSLVRERTGAARVHTLFNTHWHWEQTGSNRTLGAAGTRIMSHENTRLWLTAEVNSKWQQRVFKPLPKEAQPSKTFYSTGSLTFGGEQIDYGYLPQAHTDGDIYVYFRKANVLVAGDVMSVGSYPIVDYSTGGWIGGMVNATKSLLELANADTRIVPGVGIVQSRANVEAENAMLTSLRQKMAKMLAQGMSAKDMIEAGATREFDAAWGDPKLFVENVWQGLIHRARELGVSIV